MRFAFPTLVLLWASVFAPCTLSATSIIPFANLGEAALHSECVVLARAVESVENAEGGIIFKDTRFESLECTKGTLLAGTLFSLRPYSHLYGDYKIDIAGDFKPETGKTYLLFLNQNGDFWRPVMLSYYVFEQFQAGDDAFLVPIGGEGIELVTRPDGQVIEPLGVYYQEILLQNLQAFAAIPQLVWEGSIGQSGFRREDFEASDRAIPTGCDFTLGGANRSRWQNVAIPIYYDDTNNPANWGAKFGNILSDMTSNYTGIDPTNAGGTSYTPNCVGGSAIGGNFLNYCDNNLGGSQCALIIFDDPCNEIGDLNNCEGTLAFGGSYSSSNNHQFDGLTWDNALYGFVVVNNGVSDCLDDQEYELMLTHELTHVYRMGHLSEINFPNQNMNPTCCNAINTKDRECMNYAYPAPAPVELISFDARLQGERAVKLHWITQSEKDNDYFSIQRSANGLQYDLVQEVASSGSNLGGTYEWTDARPLSGVNYYWLSQTDFDGTQQHLGIQAVTLGKSLNILNISPNPVKGDALAFTLDIQTDFEGTLEIINPDGHVISSASLALESGAQVVHHSLDDLPSGIYLLRLYDGQEQWAKRFLKH